MPVTVRYLRLTAVVEYLSQTILIFLLLLERSLFRDQRYCAASGWEEDVRGRCENPTLLLVVGAPPEEIEGGVGLDGDLAILLGEVLPRQGG